MSDTTTTTTNTITVDKIRGSYHVQANGFTVWTTDLRSEAAAISDFLEVSNNAAVAMFVEELKRTAWPPHL